VEFAYNNNYHSSINMEPFELPYCRHCITPLNWDTIEDKVLIGLKMVQKMKEEMKTIRKD